MTSELENSNPPDAHMPKTSLCAHGQSFIHLKGLRAQLCARRKGTRKISIPGPLQKSNCACIVRAYSCDDEICALYADSRIHVKYFELNRTVSISVKRSLNTSTISLYYQTTSFLSNLNHLLRAVKPIRVRPPSSCGNFRHQEGLRAAQFLRPHRWSTYVQLTWALENSPLDSAYAPNVSSLAHCQYTLKGGTRKVNYNRALMLLVCFFCGIKGYS